MLVGYRRVAGKIGLTANESGVRGAWVEKRAALWRQLIEAGHTVFPMSKVTEQTAAELNIEKRADCPADVLFVEFGGTNMQFYGKDWEETCKIIQAHKGKVFFVCDDPDLPFVWDLLPNEDWSRWTILANAVNTNIVKVVLKVPMDARVIDYPMHIGMPWQDYSCGYIDSAVYIGRPNGRAAYFAEFAKSNNHLTVAGKEGEWADFPALKVVPIPEQKDRAAFYRKYKACLAIYDRKHKITGWRTGRAFHALHAGVPVLTVDGNDGLRWAFRISTAEHLDDFVRLTDEERREIWLKQAAAVIKPSRIGEIIISKK